MQMATSRKLIGICWQVVLILAVTGAAATARADEINRNLAERVEWFRDAGFGLFVHWSQESQLGSVFSHSMVGASEDFLKRFTEDLPRTFNPNKFDPQDWAVLAKLAGMKYVVFNTKHHSGFCMFDTATTDFNVMRTPYGKDITAQIVKAFREQGLGIGFYFSPDDFHWLYKHYKLIQRMIPEVAPAQNPGLMELDKGQIRELLMKYGSIDVLFLDGPPAGLKQLAWDIQPNILVTRGAMETPEQYIPATPLEGPWEVCLPMGTQWEYKPTNEIYMSGTELIYKLIETRAKGGNLLLAVGPRPDGQLPIEQEDRLREIALWNFVNGEAIHGVRPWVVANENDVWFTKRKDEDTVYAFVKQIPPWKFGTLRTLTLRSIQATKDTAITVLGQNDKVLEYHPEVIPQTQWQQDEDGLHITVMRAQRLYNDHTWPNPVVLKMTNVKPALWPPPEVKTSRATWDPITKTLTLEGEVRSLGRAASVDVGFQYRLGKWLLDLYADVPPWQELPYVKRTTVGAYSQKLTGLKRHQEYEFRAVLKHPQMAIYGTAVSFTPEK
jgi:alpha-L-fucosidase